MQPFVFQNPVKVIFGPDRLGELPQTLRAFGSRVLLVYGGGSIKRTGLYTRVTQGLAQASLALFELSGIAPNPRIDSVREGARLCKEHQIDVVLAVGGGSTIDAAKWICAGACDTCDPWEFIDHAHPRPVKAALPLVTVLTVAATGSEMDNGGVISNPETSEKFGMKSDWIYPRVSFLDPTLTYTVNAYQTACGAVDIMSHVMETYFAPDETMYFLDGVMESIMRTVVRFAPVALRDPENYEARANLMWASSWAINGFVRADKSQVWSCHPMEHELSAFYDITHGLGLAILTPRWLKYCYTEAVALKYAQFAVNVFGLDAKRPAKTLADEAIASLERFFFVTLGLKRTLTEAGIDEKNFARMAEKACAPSGSIEGFRVLRPADVEAIYRMCL